MIEGEIYSFSLCAYAHLKANADSPDHSLVYNKLIGLAKTGVDTMWWTSDGKIILIFKNHTIKTILTTL